MIISIVTQVQAVENKVAIEAQWRDNQLPGAAAASAAWKQDLQVLVRNDRVLHTLIYCTQYERGVHTL